MSDTNKAALPSCSFDQYIYGVCIELHSHMSTIIFSHWMAYFHPHLLPQLHKHCIRKHVVKKWKNENGNLQTAGRFTTAVKKTALTLWMKRGGEAGWTSMAESEDDLPSSAILERKNVRTFFQSFPECLLKVPVRKHGPVLSGRPLPSPLVSDWWRPLLPGPVSQWIKPDQCDSDGVLWAQ